MQQAKISRHDSYEALTTDTRRQGLGRELTNDLTAMTLFWNNRFYESLGFRRIDPSIAKQADDVASKGKHRYCTVWRKTPDAPTEPQARTKKKPGH